jgi:hypothetical protein
METLMRESPAMVDGAISPDSREDPQRQAEQEGEEHCRRRQLDCRRHEQGEILCDRAPRVDRDSQLAPGEVADEREVLLVERLVQAPFLPEGLDDLRPLRRDLAEVGDDGIGRDAGGR